VKIIHHSKTIGYGGTDKSAQFLVQGLNQIDGVDAYLMYRDDDISRLDVCREIIGDDKLIEYQHRHLDRPTPPYYPLWSNYADVINRIKPDIIHLHRSGYREWPGMKNIYSQAKLVETNIFGYADTHSSLDYSIYISDFIKQRSMRSGGKDGKVIPNPTLPRIATDKEMCRSKIVPDLPSNAVLLGRVGRPDNFCSISLDAFKLIEKKYSNVYYLVVNGCEQWRYHAKSIGLERVIFLDPIFDDNVLSEFYCAIDIYAHARADGECQPCNFNEAMMHGLPIVTHLGHSYQGHIELLNESGCGFCADYHATKCYADYLKLLITDDLLRNKLGQNGYQYAIHNLSQSIVTEQVFQVYKEILK